jgi:IS1 family transposase
MKIPLDRAVFCLRLLLEGNSIRSVERLTYTHRDTIMRLVVLVGERCQKFSEQVIHKMPVDDVQVDEIWGFVGCKKKTADRLGYSEEVGDAYCYTAIERDSKLLLAWHLGKRTASNTRWFAQKLQHATTGRFQLTTDGYTHYREAMPLWLGGRIDFAQLLKIFQPVKGNEAAVRYSPGSIREIKIRVISGNPNDDRICTSHAERHNLTIRTQVRRMTRLTNAFSKKWENHEAALALFFAYYNFCRVHGTLKTTPAVAAGLTDRTWSVERLLREMAGQP